MNKIFLFLGLMTILCLIPVFALTEKEKSYRIEDIKFDNKEAKEIIFYDLTKDYDISAEASKELKKPKDIFNIQKTKYFGDGIVKLMEKVNATKQRVKRSYDCNCKKEEIWYIDNKTKENKSKIIEVCKTCYEYENYLVEELKEINPKTYILKKNKPIYEIFYGCSKIVELPNGKFGCSLWTEINVLDVNIKEATWWNSSYTYMRDITEESTSDIAIYMNNTTGCNGENILFNPSQCVGGNSTIYYDNSSHLAIVCNDTSEMNWTYEKTGTGNNPTGIFNSNLKAYYSFGQTTQCNDSSSNNYDGTLYGNTVLSSSGKYGYCYEFDGDGDYIDFGTCSGCALTTAGKLSIVFWAYSTDFSANYKRFLSRAGGDADYSQYSIALYGTTKKLLFASNDGAWTNTYGDATLTDNAWNFVVITYDNQNISFYINGIYDKSATHGDTIPTTPNLKNYLCMETGDGGNRDYFAGKMDEVRIYKGTLLTQTQISEIYNQSVGVYNNFGSEEIKNQPPNKPTVNTPPDTATNKELSVILNVTVTDPDGDNMNVSFWDNTTGNQINTTQINIPNGSSATVIWDSLNYSTTYYWYANATDGIYETKSEVWSFTTKSSFVLNLIRRQILYPIREIIFP